MQEASIHVALFSTWTIISLCSTYKRWLFWLNHFCASYHNSLSFSELFLLIFGIKAKLLVLWFTRIAMLNDQTRGLKGVNERQYLFCSKTIMTSISTNPDSPLKNKRSILTRETHIPTSEMICSKKCNKHKWTIRLRDPIFREVR